MLFLLISQLMWLAAARSFVGVGWGITPRELPEGMLAPGWMTNLTDNLGYSAFVQQNRWGETGTGILYTTTPHPAGYFNVLFWSLGRLAGLTDTRPEAWLLITGIGAALACTAGVCSVGHLLGGPRVALVAGLVSVFGSGWTWIQRVAAKAFGWEHYHAADLRFMDLLPSSAALFYAPHIVGLALMSWISWLLLSLEQTPHGAPHHRREAFLGLLAVLLSWVRPYEPVIICVVYGLYAVAGLLQKETGAWLRVRRLAVMAAAILPALVYSAWLSLQPVWSILARVSLSLAHERSFWLQGFGGLWIIAGFGVWLWRTSAGPRRFVVVWYLFAVVLLVILDTRHTKLLSGVGLPLALAAGHGLVAVWDQLRARLGSAAAIPVIALLAIIFAGPGSLAVALRESRLDRPRVEASVWQAAAQIRQDCPSGTPTVLAESAAGGMLPGIIGARIWAGHWVLTDHGEAKTARLRAAGLEPDSPAGQPGETLIELRALLNDSHADYLLIRNTAPAAAIVAQLPALQPLAQTNGWLLFVHRTDSHP